MTVSVFDLFKIGVGPSSSHTVGPMKAANRFVLDMESRRLLDSAARVECNLFGSLAMTGHGHATDIAVILGLLGEDPGETDPALMNEKTARVRETGILNLGGRREIAWNERSDLVFRFGEFRQEHSNAMIFTAYDAAGNQIFEEEFFSVGGGFVLSVDDLIASRTGADTGAGAGENTAWPYPFKSARELLKIGAREGLSIAQIARANEAARLSESEINEGLDGIWAAMNSCIERGMHATGILPGGLKVVRRANKILTNLQNKDNKSGDTLEPLDWVNLFALAVNEENAAGGRVVTAPTNGAAGVIPSVIAYYERFIPGATPEGVRDMLLTAAAIGSLYKENASISAAEVGCQGEVGVACSMAAGALCAALGGTNAQIENAAEIGMEHNLGLTCDPIGGLVQIPCIERNTMGAVKAINAARLALHGDGVHHVPLDDCIKTMLETGKDMQAKYKETSEGGLAVNIVEC
ncbi:MAG: L-serine ammonia-lyase [Rhodospirillales bacterium]